MTRASVFAVVLLVACGESGDSGVQNPVRDQYETWIKIEPPGIVCGNNTQYKFFASFSATSDKLVVVFEPGGACWDYDSCTGRNGIRGAANVDGLKDNHWEKASFISPFLSRFDDTSPSRDWNMVYIPYCTGDVHTGNNVVTYDPLSCGDMLAFAINCLRNRLTQMLPRAGAADLAAKVDIALVNAVVDDVEVVASQALTNVRRLQAASGG